MNDLELKQLWQQQTASLPTRAQDEGIVERMKKRMRRFDRTIFWRDARELAACGLVLCWFCTYLSARHSVLTRAGGVVVILSCVFIAWRLISARLAQRSFLNPDSVSSFLAGELTKVTRQIRLLQTVLWWYVLPIYAGVALVFLGGKPDLADKLTVLIVLVLMGGFIHWLNQYAVRKTLMPLKLELEAALQSMQELPD